MRAIRRLVAPLALLALLAPTRVQADEASGTWTGQVELRTNYYWETSTRVVAPEVRARLDSPEGTRVTAGYLLDAITSASLAAGVQEDIRFTEVRNQGTLGLSQELDLGEAQLRLGTAGRVSHEPDYVATGLTAFASLALNRRATVINASLTYIHDDVGSVLRGGAPRVDDDTGRDLSDRGRQGQLEGVTAVVSWNQVLTPVTTLVTGYQLVHNWGFLQNVYRRTSVAGSLTSENHPEQRTRHSIWGRLAHFFPESRTAVHLMYRAYIDDWDVAAINPEVRVYQMIGSSVMLRARYRYHHQTPSFFWQAMYDSPQPYVTADPKMSPFSSHLFGGQLRVALDFLGRTPLSFLDRAWIDFSFDYWLQTSAFGDAILAQAGLRVPF
ncbi:MAG TPA: DUF3570 domain-containing protein [Sandaracinaceae bacterium LLY-WYZ-13_1]|nr:DUF3570 domain-containing protein [Sandaracinaceae bacterium LLY-WYZ-13_1]